MAKKHLILSFLTIFFYFLSYSFAHQSEPDGDVNVYDDCIFIWGDSTDNHPIHDVVSSYTVVSKSLIPYSVKNEAEVGLTAYASVKAAATWRRELLGPPIITAGTFHLHAEVGRRDAAAGKTVYDEDTSTIGFHWGGVFDYVNAWTYQNPGHAMGLHHISDYYAKGVGSISVANSGYNASTYATR